MARPKFTPIKSKYFVSPTEDIKEQSEELTDKLNRLKTVDVTTKIIIRILFIFFFLSLLGFQNFKVFTLVYKAQEQGKLGEFQVVLSILTSSTLAETYFVIKQIVKWLVKDIDYKSLRD